MRGNGKLSSISLSGLFLLSVLLSLAIPAGTVSAQNETTSGVITGAETWAGVHTLTGNVTIAPGAKLTINPGALVSFPNGTHLDVRGSLCAGSTNCNAPSNSNPAMQITLRWEEPENSSARGKCYGLSAGNQEIWIEDPSCFEGVLMRSSIDLAETELRHVVFDGPWGIPYYISSIGEFRYGALVLDGASPTLTELSFNQVNTSSVLTTNLAQPTIIGGQFSVGQDENTGIVGGALQIFSSGSSVNPFSISDISLTGTNNGCQNNDDGRHVIWADKSFIEIDNMDIPSGDFGVSLRSSAGKVTNSVINVDCNGIDVYAKKAVGSSSFDFQISNNEITTTDGTGVTAYAGALVALENNDIEGAGSRSGIEVYNSDVSIHGNEIGPIDGYFGLWLGGSFDVIAENNSIFQTSLTPVVAGFYSNAIEAASRLFMANNTISYDGTGTCNSNTHWDGQFPCPVVHAYVTGVTMYDNTISAGGNADGIRAIGSLLDIQRNSFDVQKTGAVIKNFDTGYADREQYGSLAYFSENNWNQVESTYNVTKSSITAQSEYIPSPPTGEYPVRLSWPDQQALPDNGFQGQILPTPVKECANCKNMTPRNFPLGLSMDNNSTVFTFANLTNLNLGNIKIATQPTHYAVQVSRAELVRFQTLIEGEKVSDAMVIVEDAVGNELYRVKTLEDGFTPWIALPSNFHLDFRGLQGGDNPDGFADDQFEDSCSDGIDNDGDLAIDANDPSCDYSAGTREMSLYRYTAYRFGFGYYNGQFILEENSLQETAHLVNAAPSVQVTEQDGHSFRRIVNITGRAHDGQLANSYASDELAQWDQGGFVHYVQVKNPFTSSWEDSEIAVDISGAQDGEVTRFNHPYKDWFYTIDLEGLAVEGDYTFEFRAFDGIDYSPIVSRTIKLNTQPPTTFVSTPSSFSQHDDGSIAFEGYSQDPYGCPSECNKDLGLVWFQIDGPGYQTITPVPTNEDGTWNWEWDFSTRPRELETYTFTIWTSDSDFCDGEIDECQPVVLTLTIDHRNSRPTISVNQPISGTRISSSEDTQISGIARDFDGEVTRVDMEVKDATNDYIVVSETSTSEFSEDGEWEIVWDTTQLRHDSEYLLRFRSYDGLNFSDWSQVTIIADNPPNAGNNKPAFDSSNWDSEITLYCDSESNSVDKCTSVEIDLKDFFSDEDNDIEFFSVYNNISSPDDDMHELVVGVGSDGVARFDPADMLYYDDDMQTWSLSNVIFIATDAWDSKANSDPINFEVIPLEFSINEPEKSWFDEQEIALYSGIGLPGKQVSVLIGGVPVNTTIISENGTWELGVPGTRIKESSTPEFDYSGQTTTVEPITKGQPLPQSTDWLAIGAIAFVAIVALSLLAYFTGFIGIEIDEEDSQIIKEPAQIEENFGEEEHKSQTDEKWWDESASAESNHLERHDDQPGWLWDSVAEEWVPDPDYEN